MIDEFVTVDYFEEFKKAEKLSKEELIKKILADQEWLTNEDYALKSCLAKHLGVKVDHGVWSKQEFLDNGYSVEEIINVEKLK